MTHRWDRMEVIDALRETVDAAYELRRLGIPDGLPYPGPDLEGDRLLAGDPTTREHFAAVWLRRRVTDPAMLPSKRKVVR